MVSREALALLSLNVLTIAFPEHGRSWRKKIRHGSMHAAIFRKLILGTH